MQRYKVLKDDDGHYYVVPAEKEDLFDKWVEAGPYWEGYEGEDFEKYALGGSLSLLTFSYPQVE
jgi:hypothetical protein